MEEVSSAVEVSEDPPLCFREYHPKKAQMPTSSIAVPMRPATTLPVSAASARCMLAAKATTARNALNHEGTRIAFAILVDERMDERPA